VSAGGVAKVLAEGRETLAEVREIVDGDLTEDGLALWFARQYPHYRRVHGPGQWLRWDNTRWRPDTTAALFAEIRTFLRNRSRSDATDEPTRKLLRKAQTVAAVERLSQSHQPWATVPADWDADSWLLGTPGGVLDLRTGALAPADPSFLITKQTAVSPAGECPLWLQFLDVVTDGDPELVQFLRRMAGYSLTGSTREHALFFIYGTGRNGKGVFISALAGVMADYATTAPMETFTESLGDRHPTDLAGLMGARLVFANETEEGKQWNEARIKTLTGGDRISARFMRGDFFSFQPTFKLLIAGNHRPRLRSVDAAMRARLHLIPFTVTIPPERRDPELPEKLRAEWPGILQWAVEGCLDYQAQGLAPPACVRQATESYFGSQDVFGAWIADCCELGPTLWDQPTRLFASWRRYADAARERVGRQAEFGDRMESAGFQQIRDRLGRRWLGITVKAESPWEGDP
jgi:putative DNA primase/helicase